MNATTELGCFFKKTSKSSTTSTGLFFIDVDTVGGVAFAIGEGLVVIDARRAIFATRFLLPFELELNHPAQYPKSNMPTMVNNTIDDPATYL